jgi:TolB-like protein
MRGCAARLAIALVIAGAPTGARADGHKAVVAVLYFDNNSPNRDYDVLKKGLADMLITDLSAVDALEVVEREKLEKLLDELKLQRSRYFDPKTAQTLGHGIGAEYAVTGAIAAFDPETRIDVRMIDVASGKVVVAASVTGKKDQLFELEAQLVKKFVDALHVKMAPPREGGRKADLGAILKYSQGVDAADRGDLPQASKQLAEVVQAAPEFALAQDRYVEVLRRLREAGKRRDALHDTREHDVVTRFKAALAQMDASKWKPKPDQAAVRKYGIYRAALAELYEWKLQHAIQENHGAGGTVIPQAQLPTVEEALDEALAFAADDRRCAGCLKNLLGGEHSCRPVKAADLEPADAALLERFNTGEKRVELEERCRRHVTLLALAEWALAGTGEPPWSTRSSYPPPSTWWNPPLACLDHAYALKLVDALRAEERDARAADPKVDPTEWMDLEAELLRAAGRKAEALTVWQKLLDGNPDSRRYKEIEHRVEELVGATKPADLQSSFKTRRYACPK